MTNKIKICVCAVSPELNSKVSPAFGRSPYFLIIDSETGEFKAIENSVLETGRGVGVGASQIIVSHKVKAVVCSNFGPNAFSVLKMSGIKIYPATPDLTVKEILEKYKNGELKEIKIPTAPGHFGFNRGGPGFRRSLRLRRRFRRRGR